MNNDTHGQTKRFKDKRTVRLEGQKGFSTSEQNRERTITQREREDPGLVSLNWITSSKRLDRNLTGVFMHVCCVCLSF